MLWDMSRLYFKASGAKVLVSGCQEGWETKTQCEPSAQERRDKLCMDDHG